MQWVVAAYFLIAVFLIAIWDVYALASDQPAATASRVIGNWSQAYPVLPFGIGVVIGHVFWPRGG